MIPTNLVPAKDSLPFDDLVIGEKYMVTARAELYSGGTFIATFVEFSGRRGQPLGVVLLLPPDGVFMTFRRNHLLRIAKAT